MTIEFRAIEATCRRFIFNPYLLESQFLHDAPTGLVSVEIADADCLRAKVAERVPNSCVCRLRRHVLYLSLLAGNSRRDEFAPDSTLRHAIFTASVNR